MGLRGPNRTPTIVKKLRGTDRKDRVLPGEVSYTPMEKVPAPPKEWPLSAKKYFRSMSKELLDKGLLFKTDIASLQAYCFAWYQMDLAEKKLILSVGEDGDKNSFIISFTNKKGHTNLMISPWLKVKSDAIMIIDKFSSKFGFSPSDKTRIAVPFSNQLDMFDEL